MKTISWIILMHFVIASFFLSIIERKISFQHFKLNSYQVNNINCWRKQFFSLNALLTFWRKYLLQCSYHFKLAHSSDLSEIFMTLRNKLFLYLVPKVFNLTEEKMWRTDPFDRIFFHLTEFSLSQNSCLLRFCFLFGRR